MERFYGFNLLIWFLNTNENKLSTQKNKSEKNPVKLSKYAIRKRPQTFAIVIKNEMEEKNRIKWPFCERKYIRILVSTRLKPAFTQFKREETSRWSQSIKNVGTLHAKSFFNWVFFPFFFEHWALNDISVLTSVRSIFHPSFP